jgi:thymidylate kinase
MNKGKYIVIEGPEGVGKTTQLQELARRLQAAGLPVRTLREPDSHSNLTARARLSSHQQYYQFCRRRHTAGPMHRA